MSFERQGRVVTGTRAAASQLTEHFNDIESFLAEYDVLNLETPNFANGFFGTTQEIVANDLLGVFNSFNALKAAAPNEFGALRAALRKARS